MKIEPLHIAECPSWIEAGRRVSEALRETGHEATELHYRLIRSKKDAAEVTSALAGLAGLPTVEQIRKAILTHRN